MTGNSVHHDFLSVFPFISLCGMHSGADADYTIETWRSVEAKALLTAYSEHKVSDGLLNKIMATI